MKRLALGLAVVSAVILMDGGVAPFGLQRQLNTDRFDREARGAGTVEESGGGNSGPDHVFLILMENKEYGEVIDSPKAPYINSLADSYGSAGNYYAVRHPSLPNYLALASGYTQGVTDDCASCSYDSQNLVDQLEANQKSWKAYMEDLPAPGFNGGSHGQYVRRHDPWMYFTDISGDPARSSRVVPLSQFSTDLRNNQLPDFVWITPNMIHDMHDGSVQDGDNWLASFVPRILASPAWQNNGVLFIVWDEGDTDKGLGGSPGGGHTIALVVAAQGKRGYRSTVPYNHYSLLRTIEERWNLGYMGHAGDPGIQAMDDFFQ